MKRSSLFLTLTMTLLLSFGLVQGQPLDGSIYIGDLSGDWSAGGAVAIGDTIKTNTAVVWTMNLSNQTGQPLVSNNNGFRIYSPDGATWQLPGISQVGTEFDVAYTPANVFPYASAFNTGAGAVGDTVGIGGFDTRNPAIGFADGYDQAAILVTIPAPGVAGADGTHICIAESGYAVNFVWLWALLDGSGGGPIWGPLPSGYGADQCYTIYTVPNEPPDITNCTASLNFDHCATATYQFTAQDRDALGARPLTFVQNSGPGTTTPSGMWSYSPSLADVGASLTLSVSAQDDPGNVGPACEISLNFTNVCPSFTSGCGAVVAVGKGNSVNHAVGASSGDCDPITYSIGTVTPPPAGSYSINPNTGLITFNTVDPDDGGNLYDFEVIVSDGKCDDTCHVYFDVLVVEPYRVEIEKTHNTIQGGHELVCVSMTAGSEEPWGFDFLISYDQSALSLVGAIEGEVYDECGWEYFNYRFGANGNCSGGCPSGLVRVVGLAETNNGSNHPSCYLPTLPSTLFCLDFLVTNDQLFECQYIPVRFWWLDCGDNTISFNPSDDPTGFEQRLAISRDVYDFDLIGNIANPNVGYPTYQGAQDEDCFPEDADPQKPAPVRFIDFVNGGIDIVCIDSIDDRGDINLNNVSNEVADAVLFTNYFIYGIGVFTVNVAGQIAATDVNVDGLTLTVADLVYLIRIVIGDANPYPKLTPVEAILTLNREGNLNISGAEAGAAAVVLAGRVEPILLADNMNLEYAYDEANNVTRAIVVSPLSEGMTSMESFTGDFLNTGGAEVVNVELATTEGAQILAKEVELPTDFALNQNYPNPFNPTTRISFALPTASDYTLTIYNVTGQKVTEFTGTKEAGSWTIEWDATNNASGVYFYKLVAGEFTGTKKMVLVR